MRNRIKMWCSRLVKAHLFALLVGMPFVAWAGEPDSLKALEAVVQASPKDSDAWVRLG